MHRIDEQTMQKSITHEQSSGSKGKELSRSQPCGYVAALGVTWILLPGTATFFTVIFVLAEWLDYISAPVLGTLAAFASWLVLSSLCCWVADAKYAIPSSYGELLPRLDELGAHITCFCQAAWSQRNQCTNTAYYAASEQYNGIRKDLEEKGCAWALATGYSKVWDRLYRAEENMIEFAPLKKVLESTLYDESRLEGSEIKNRDDLLAKLRKAITSIDPSTDKYLKSTASVTLPPALAIGTTTLPGGTIAENYSALLMATGGVPPYNWKVIGGAIPDGLVLITAGILRGTPTSDGHGNFTVQVTDSAGVAIEKYFDLLISPPKQTPAQLTFSTTSPLPPGTVGVEYSERLFVTGGTPPYKWSITDGVKPDGLDLSPSGVLSGKPAADNTYEFTVEVIDSTSTPPAARQFALTIKPSGTSAVIPVGGTQVEMNARGVLSEVRHSLNEYRNSRWKGLIMARNRLLATFTLTSMVVFVLLSIAIMDGADRNAVIAATVFYLVGATVGLCNRLRSESQAESAIADYGLSAARLITIPLFSGLGAIGGLLFIAYLPYAAPVFAPAFTPLAISTSSSLPKATLNKPYKTEFSANGGTQPYKWAVIESTKGAIPASMQFSDSGVLSGTPTKAGQGDQFVVEITDSGGNKLLKKFTLPLDTLTPREATKKVADQASKQAPGAVGSPTKAPAPAVVTMEKVKPQAPVKAAGVDGKAAAKAQAPAIGALKGDTPQPLGQEGSDSKMPPVSEKTSPKLEDIFDIKKNLIGLFVAAVFGLAPGMLFDRLQQQADRYKADLKSSQSTEEAQKT
jgi:hypothetical protein